MKTKDSADLLGQNAGRALDAFALWAEAGQTIARHAAELTLKAAEEGTRLFVAWQSSALEAAKENFGRLSESGQATVRAGQVVQAAGDQAAAQIRGTVSDLASKVSDLYTPAKG